MNAAHPPDAVASRPRPRDGVASVTLDGEAVLYDGTTKTLHHLNAAATLVWLHCDGHRTVATISRMIAEDSHANVRDVTRDVTELVRALTDAELLVIVDPPA
jgi:hypothetical protein